MLQIHELSKRFGKKVVLEHITLSLEDCSYGLLGPNGSGKTTLFRILAGLLPPSGGEIRPETKSLRIGYLPQRFGPFPYLTVEEQLGYFAQLKARKNDGISWREEVNRALALVNLEAQKGEKCRTLSGGMVRRLGIAQAMMGKPNLILLDEPTVGLDIEERQQFKEILKTLQGQQPLLLSTHILDDVEDTCAEVIVLHHQGVLYQGPLAVLGQSAASLEAGYLQLLKGAKQNAPGC